VARAGRTVKGLPLKLCKFSATTPAGLFAKAGAVSPTGSSAAAVAVLLANDLLASAELCQAVWPSADRNRFREFPFLELNENSVAPCGHRQRRGPF
jgi:hypothetical protein